MRSLHLGVSQQLSEARYLFLSIIVGVMMIDDGSSVHGVFRMMVDEVSDRCTEVVKVSLKPSILLHESRVGREERKMTEIRGKEKWRWSIVMILATWLHMAHFA